MNLLIVDDEELEIEIIQKLIDPSQINFQEIYTASSMKKAKEILENHFISIMICDIQMPRGSGIDLTKWIREQKMDIVVIYLTGHANFNYATNAIRLAVSDYLLKPVEQKCLMDALSKAAKHFPKEEEKEEINTISIQKIKNYIDIHCNKEITRKQIADEFFIHQDYFSRFFKEQTGKNFSEYVLERRLEKAKQMLKKGEASISYIATVVGFSSTAYFAKQFKKEIGVTPSEYRKNKR